jgi:hypothetical protein
LRAVFLFMRWWYEAHLNEHLRSGCSVERTLLAPEEQHSSANQASSSLPLSSKAGYGSVGTHELVPLVPHQA